MSPARIQMAQPPADPDGAPDFGKLPRARAHRSRAARPHEEDEPFTAEQARRAHWLLVAAVGTVLVVGGLLIAAGL